MMKSCNHVSHLYLKDGKPNKCPIICDGIDDSKGETRGLAPLLEKSWGILVAGIDWHSISVLALLCLSCMPALEFSAIECKMSYSFVAAIFNERPTQFKQLRVSYKHAAK